MVRPVDVNEVGDLVPMRSDEYWPSRDMGPTYQEQLKELAHKTTAVRRRWKWDLLPLGDGPLKVALERTAYICAVQLSGGNCGVMRMDPATGDCHLFLRLGRTDWFAWADKNKVPRSGGRVFSKRMDDALGKKMLMDACGRTLGLRDVHHPHVLSLLCTMSKHGWMDHVVEENEEYVDPAQMGTFTLVALQPLPAEFEQCLRLLGHSAAFVKDNAGSDDDEVSLSTRSDATPIPEVWGTILAGDLVKGPLAHHFEQGAREVGKHAAPCLFGVDIPDFNKYAPIQTRILNHLRRVTDTVPMQQQPEPATESPQPYLDPSDNEEELEAAVAVAAAAAAAAAAATKAMPVMAAVAESPSPSSQPQPQPQPQPRQRQRTNPPAARNRKRGRAKASDSDDLSDSDEDDTSENGTSEEEDSSSGSDDSGSDDSGSDDSGSGSGSGSGSSSSGSGSGSESESGSPDTSPLPASKRARSKARAPDLDNDQGLLTVLAEMAKPCCARLKKLKRGHGVGLKVRHHNQLVDDLKLLETAASPVALLAAALNIITTLADIQSDRFRGDAVLVRCSEAERLCNMAAQAGEFAMGVRELLKDAHTAEDPQ